MAISEDENNTEKTMQVPITDSKKSIIIKWAVISVILLLFIGIEVGMSVFFVEKLKEPEAIDIEKQNEELEKENALKLQTSMGATLASPIEVTVNINGEDGRYLKCGVQLEYDPSFETLGAELEVRRARIKDIIMEIMSEKPLSELMTNDGKRAIREQIVAEVNAILPKTTGKDTDFGKVTRSYFDSFIMQ